MCVHTVQIAIASVDWNRVKTLAAATQKQTVAYSVVWTQYIYISLSLEAQKSSGAEHGHMQVFVQCLHQHTSLEEIFRLSHDKLAALRAEYEAYNVHVCHASYVGQSNEDMERRIAAAEASCPELPFLLI